MLKVDYDKLREIDAEPLKEFEEQIIEKMRRELEAKKSGEGKGKGKGGRR
ncbi:MAG: hypothetical protein U9R79_21105 [Armatimonadota bacterium]|nr:hypothetical protein [Armatimonadota bacterium]